MKQRYSSYFSYFSGLDWQHAAEFSFSEQHDPQWLQEQGSLSQLFSQQCQRLVAEVVRNQLVPVHELTDFQKSMLFEHSCDDQDCLVRDVILAADGEPWLLGSTIIPRSSLSDEQFDLSQIGEKPLGLTVFQAQQVARDQLHLGTVDSPLGQLAARSSRLWMNNKPMLVAELFLPPSPIYRKE
ncbi:chorismate lyase [Vibrio gangliei]|uniref:chorismate lyase n=1 Tax=Vibrio gangliei TaxID=2077090 RepID=UPI000D01F215|nr:chorismate lyase [Vibrio gangliei]